jgi:hypothetical protein
MTVITVTLISFTPVNIDGLVNWLTNNQDYFYLKNGKSGLLLLLILEKYK